MKFLVDAQLPRRFIGWLETQGHDAIHTSDLPLKNATSNQEVISRAVAEGRIVVTKDSDFVQSFLLNGDPALLLISTGNISNFNLENLVQANLSLIAVAFKDHRFVEISNDGVITRD